MKTVDRNRLGGALKKLREEKGVSQETLAKALNIPRPSVAQIEKGARDVSVGELDVILEIFQISYNDFLELIRPHQKKEKTKKVKIKFNEEKFKQLLLYILQKCGGKPNVGETVLYKLLYFCDFDYFELYEKPLTGMPYKRLQYGPVPSQCVYNPIINKMIKNNELERISRPYVGETIQTRYIACVEVNQSIFLPQEIRVIERVINRLSDLNARQIEDHVHHDYPWLIHTDNEIIDYGSVFGREGEFAQRDYASEFLQASARDSFGSLPPLTKEEYEYYINLPDLPKNK